MNGRRSILALAVLVLAVLAVMPASGRAASACPSTFAVLHDDRIGSLQLPKGNYRIAVTRLSCDSASQLFTAFLDDWDGKLPRPWKTTVQGRGRGTFTGSGGQRFTVRFGGTGGGGGGGGGRHPASGLVCGQTIVLTQADRIGALKLKKGRYLIDRLSTLSPSCTQAAVLFGQFLQDFDGKLPGGWVLLPDDGTFLRGSSTYGFRLEPDPTGGGGKKFPAKTTRCGPTFRVVHNDHVGALRYPAGNYWVSIYKHSGITCPQSSRLFASFLARTDGRLPKPWVIDVATGSFRRGRGSAFGFVAKPTFRVH